MQEPERGEAQVAGGLGEHQERERGDESARKDEPGGRGVGMAERAASVAGEPEEKTEGGRREQEGFRREAREGGERGPFF